MPSVKIPKKSTDTDMTPFVDIAFLLLSFFIMATKFKPPEPVKVETPNSVSSDKLKTENSVLITIDNQSKVYVSFGGKTDADKAKINGIITDINASRNLGLTAQEINNFATTPIIGVPFGGLKDLLKRPIQERETIKQPGIPVLDSLTNELVWWIGAAKKAFGGTKLIYLLKGDNTSKYPAFEAVINSLRRNEEFKYFLITGQEGAPAGSELSTMRAKASQGTQ
ncbi:MAG: biopolymer transporter ExbD [Chitinophagaceae bacterium]|nr:MAG: biopolymer transporter ExbD [Chitinophagaceae bacterium]